MTDRTIVARFRKPEDFPAMPAMEADDAMSDEATFETYEVRTTEGEGQEIHNAVIDAANEGYDTGALDGVILDAPRYAKLAAWMSNDPHAPTGPRVVDPASRFSFDLRAVHAAGNEVCEPLYSNDKKMWESEGGGEP